MKTKIQADLRFWADEEKQKVLSHFFKTGLGQYGHGDCFLGITVPRVREVARQYTHIPLSDVAELLESTWHEERLCALLILVLRFQSVDSSGKNSIFHFYLAHTDAINNWDLVDLTAPYIVGEYMLSHQDRSFLYRLVQSSSLWEQRIAVVSTLTLIRHGEYDVTLQLAELLLFHRHDLMHKAVGWMLREVGKRNKSLLEAFLQAHGKEMPRTMLRYSIEKFPEAQRQYYLRSTR